MNRESFGLTTYGDKDCSRTGRPKTYIKRTILEIMKDMYPNHKDKEKLQVIKEILYNIDELDERSQIYILSVLTNELGGK